MEATPATGAGANASTTCLAISETGSIQAEQLAIDQINAMGGILGRKIRVIKEDGASDWPTFAEKSKKLLINDRCAAVFGCWTSASRKAVLPVFEKENGLLYYPTFYEGLEQSKNVIYTGQEATQQILYSLDWAKAEKKAKTFFLIGSDYIWPRTSMKIARKHIENFQKGKVVGNLKKGDSFGEIALVHDVVRTATVKATSEEVHVMSLSREAFQHVLDEHAKSKGKRKLENSAEAMLLKDRMRRLDSVTEGGGGGGDGSGG